MSPFIQEWMRLENMHGYMPRLFKFECYECFLTRTGHIDDITPANGPRYDAHLILIVCDDNGDKRIKNNVEWIRDRFELIELE